MHGEWSYTFKTKPTAKILSKQRSECNEYKLLSTVQLNYQNNITRPKLFLQIVKRGKVNQFQVYRLSTEGVCVVST